MPTYRDDVVVLRTHRLGETDRIVTMLGKSHGRIRAVAKGVRKTTSSIGARLEPFQVADVQFFEGRTLDTVQQVVTKFALAKEIVADYELYTTASAIVEAADRLTEHGGVAGHFDLLVGGLRSLAAKAHEPGLVLDSYLLRALRIAGWTPELDECVISGVAGEHTAFVVAAGGVVADAVAPPGTPRLRPDSIALLRALLAGDWSIADVSEPEARNEARGIVAAYTQFHLERTIRSLGHIERSPRG